MAGRRGGIFRYQPEDASFLGMTGGFVRMTRKICPETSFSIIIEALWITG
jgi:hypothetical protein